MTAGPPSCYSRTMAILKKVNRLTVCLDCVDESADRGLNKLNAWLRAFEIEPTSTRRVDQITHESPEP